MIFCHVFLLGIRQNVRCRATVSYFGVDKRDGKFFDSSFMRCYVCTLTMKI